MYFELSLSLTFRKDKSCLPCDEQQPLQESDCPSVAIPMRQAVTHALPPDGSHVVTVLAPSVTRQQSNRSHSSSVSSMYASKYYLKF